MQWQRIPRGPAHPDYWGWLYRVRGRSRRREKRCERHLGGNGRSYFTTRCRPQTSDYFRAAHTAQGVDIREGVGLDHLIERDGRVVPPNLAMAAKSKLILQLLELVFYPRPNWQRPQASH